MTFRQAIRTCFENYLRFSGRAARPEYWWFALFIFLGSFVAGFLDGVFLGAAKVETVVAPGQFHFSAQSNGPIANVFMLFTVLPFMAVGWRRMHDSGRSGLHLLYPLIVMVGMFGFAAFTGGLDALQRGEDLHGGVAAVLGLATIVFILSPFIVLWWLTRPSQPGTNAYGPNPQKVMP